MKKFMFALLSAVTAFSQTSTIAKAKTLPIETYTANDAGFAVNSHLILGEKEAILVDAQFTRSEARKVADMIRRSGRELRQIFITHGHPDHYFGLETLLKEFPRAEAITTPEVLADIRATAQGKLSYWKPMYKNDLPDKLVLPNSTNATSLTLDGQTIAIIKVGPGESEHLAMLFLPASGALISGDLAYHQVHLWVAENRPEAWLNNLDEVRRITGLKTVYPGHGTTHDLAILDEDRAYLESFLAITASAKDKAAAIKNLEQRYPTYRLPVIAELSVAARIP
jgi:glyoxylase-like metal-dependent hydrolase (beta-lactamase superfamily II)